jgi:hypothetical protein
VPAAIELYKLGAVQTLTKNSRHCLLRIIFFICEAAFVASFAAKEVLWHRYHRAATEASSVYDFTFLISVTALLVICFCLRRTQRSLSVIGWITVFVLFGYGVLTPQL